MTDLKNHMKCYRHRVCNEDFPCEVCQSWSEKKRVVVNKMIERKKSEAAGKSATVMVWLQKIPLWGNRPESQLLSEERQNGDNMTQSILAPQAGYVPPFRLTNFERQWQQYQENFMRNLTDARFKN